MVTAGQNVTVTGSGSAANPYIISAILDLAVLDTPTVDMTLAGDILSAAVKLDPAAGNLIVATANGLRIDCAAVAVCFAGGLTVVDTSTIDLTLTGAGTAASPWVLSGVANVDAMNVALDPEANNLLTQSPAGLDAQIHHGCGLRGAGTLADPLFVDVNGTVWPFACSETNGGKVYCEPVSGGLVVDPEKFMVDTYIRNHVAGTGAGTSFPAGTDVGAMDPSGGVSPVAVPTGNIVTSVLTNPSPCRQMRVRFEVGIEHLNLRSQATGGGRINVLLGAMLTSTGGITIAAGPGQNHQSWLFESPDDFDIAWDTTSSNYISTLFTLAAGAVANLSLQATIRVVNENNADGAVADWAIFTRVTGYNI